MFVQPYLCFEGRCEEALEFYKSALGAKVEMLMRFSDKPDHCQGMPPGTENKVMHTTLTLGDTKLMASDGRCSGEPKFEGISLSLSVSDPSEAQSVFKALEDGGEVRMPLAETFYSPLFGMVTDRFGVNWMVIVHQD